MAARMTAIFFTRKVTGQLWSVLPKATWSKRTKDKKANSEPARKGRNPGPGWEGLPRPIREEK